MSHSHRRHPSAPPAVIVQATKTPGLLSLSKPARPSTPRSHTQPSRQQRATPRAKATPNHGQRSPAQAKNNSAEDDKKDVDAAKPVSDVAVAPPKLTVTQTPERSSRGRSHNKPSKDKGARRSASHSTVRISSGRHQPSPPVPDVVNSQAEAAELSDRPSLNPVHGSNANSFDPFLVSDDSDAPGAEPVSAAARSATPVKSKQAGVIPFIPKLNSRPSGRLARRRQPPTRSGSPTPSRVKAKAVPVPRVGTPLKADRDSATAELSRSDPVRSKISDRPAAKRFATTSSLSTTSSTLPEWESFPICDDTDDTDDTTSPSTPVREGVTWQQTVFALEDAPRTAPLSSTTGWPFGGQSAQSTPLKRERPRYHQRAPSEGVFMMSSDEETSNSPYSVQQASKSMSALLKRQSLPNSRTGGKRGLRSPANDEEEKAPYFASSMFQNSPSPDDLPAPTFGARF
ncbi:hypothetical protein OE88DRAFT_1737186 [Heliocybe sulcata]|uniref:Uncharacterized protein n=1 Tax=Heliocybe sulcata TaxID=5364 RepID=A0A5C3MVA6_9AGAM|nr:hypothetical protein OE88DRAFT_1737186 [Heliocybe sulcata]